MAMIDNLMSMFGGAGNSIGQGLGNMGGGLMNMFGGGGNKSSGGGGMSFGPMAAGAGLMGAGQLFGGNTKAPNLNTSQVQNYQNFTQSPPQLPQGMQDEINKSLSIKEDQENRNLDNTYKSLRPGTDYTTDSNYQRDKGNLSRQQQSDRANAMMGPTLQYLQPMQQGLADQAQMSMQGPVLRAGMQSQQSQQMKNMFGNLGTIAFTKGMFPNGMMGGFNSGNKGNTTSSSSYTPNNNFMNQFNTQSSSPESFGLDLPYL